MKVAAAPDESVALLMDGVLKLVLSAYLEEAKQVLEDTTGLGSHAP